MRYKTFSPKVDTKRRLVMTRFYTGVKESNSFCYVVNRINKKDEIDKRFKSLYSYGTDDYKSVKEFSNSRTGEKTKVFKSPFKSVFKVEQKNNPVEVWKSTKI
jgi:hypothetical protein